jgi:CheY-like chemotaxis protein
VIIVDDNVDLAELFGELVRMRGYEVTVVNDPASALAMLDQVRPEIGVLDIGLPGMDGYQLAAEVHARFPECRLIALTGYSGDAAKIVSAGFVAHLVKPVEGEALLALLARQ